MISVENHVKIIMTAHIHITGAPGSGKTTIAEAISDRWKMAHLDTDDFFWVPTDPPYQYPRLDQQRQSLLKAELSRYPSWVLCGSLYGWGDIFIPLFDLVVFIFTPTSIRLERLRVREKARFGARIALGGDMYQIHQDFLAMTSPYDEGDATIRSRERDELWMSLLPCPWLYIDGTQPVDMQIKSIESNGVIVQCAKNVGLYKKDVT